MKSDSEKSTLFSKDYATQIADARRGRKREDHMTMMTSQVITISRTLIQVNIIAGQMAMMKKIPKMIIHSRGRMTTAKAMTRSKFSKNTMINSMIQTSLISKIRRPMLIEHRDQGRFADATRYACRCRNLSRSHADAISNEEFCRNIRAVTHKFN